MVELRRLPCDLGVLEEAGHRALEAEAAPLVLILSFVWPFATGADAPHPPPSRWWSLCREEVPVSCVEAAWTEGSFPGRFLSWSPSAVAAAQPVLPISPVCLLSVGGSF